jgi:hypothetical protein
MSPAACALAQRLAFDREGLGELSNRKPAAADQFVGSLVAHAISTARGCVAARGTAAADLADRRSEGTR